MSMGIRAQSYAKHVRQATSSWVFYLLVAAFVVGLVFVHPPLIFQGDTDTARNYLNTIVSSLSTILALCISIILVAIQMTAGNYTHRVLDFFVRLPYNASLFLVFLITIMHSFLLMAKIREPERDPLTLPLQSEMSADLILVFICFLSLLLYMYAVVQLLKPERIIQLILREYDTAVRASRWLSALENVEQICDIVKRAASVNDSLTGTYGLMKMQEIAAKLPVPVGEGEEVLAVHRSFLNQWGEIVGVTVKEKETGITYVALDALYEQGCLYLESNSYVPAQEVVQMYRNIVFSHLLPEGQEYYAETVALRLYRLAAIAVQSTERGQQFAVRTWEVILACGENCFRLGKGYPTLFAGFLMVDEICTLFEGVCDTAFYERALLTYFSLWKAFAAVADRKDVAAWARWWSQQQWHDALRQHGRSLAMALAEHQGRQELVVTLRYLLPESADPPADETALQTIWPTLFDGIPFATNGMPGGSDSLANFCGGGSAAENRL
ncbi:DUF2254 family protein [Alicyclobacillus acidoterrestris]|uniref:DUF2254 domain-containing protein n=1 Tax=Alicyclobacillus acidoterrestris (strain ATCC 49025 / DSM 3922 / CIP 106132 / NCIMB 13137 / GD3B) TaxID=1356854 RepID=T0CGE0_ALIAG|nr:DUF2254 family protein [Alicyclobacillus acidoterrestris]EPZ51550.1 hypothetical protein N007_03045 [Alicyclobacillus acidoterrestris ATCC 49025]UNO50611.1 DUF2254 domain-containing protein [Alicyclobacillus acidoterrestris]